MVKTKNTIQGRKIFRENSLLQRNSIVNSLNSRNFSEMKSNDEKSFPNFNNL